MKHDPFSLDKLHDVVEPDPVAWWPPASGWWFVFTLLAIWGITIGTVALIRWRRNAHRRSGLRLLDEIESSSQSKYTPIQLLSELSELLKRVALASYPREAVASLTGTAWVEFLACTAPSTEFSEEPACLIAHVCFDPRKLEELAPNQLSAIFAAARKWIETHNPEFDAC